MSWRQLTVEPAHIRDESFERKWTKCSILRSILMGPPYTTRMRTTYSELEPCRPVFQAALCAAPRDVPDALTHQKRSTTSNTGDEDHCVGATDERLAGEVAAQQRDPASGIGQYLNSLKLARSIDDFPNEPALKLISGYQYHALLEFHRRCGKAAAVVARGDRTVKDWVQDHTLQLFPASHERCSSLQDVGNQTNRWNALLGLPANELHIALARSTSSFCSFTKIVMSTGHRGLGKFSCQIWWTEYMESTATALESRPHSSTVNDSVRVDATLKKAASCEICAGEAYPFMKAFTFSFGQKIEAIIHEVGIPFHCLHGAHFCHAKEKGSKYVQENMYLCTLLDTMYKRIGSPKGASTARRRFDCKKATFAFERFIVDVDVGEVR
ncbi:hypothetical protein DFH06DRAFT_1298935 [Mycena polygramma]|nr:hypothetical protein DFH06DRAFT_1298935 [Mycena polygramma]